MRHRKGLAKLGRKAAHLKALQSSLVCNLIEEKRIRTTLPKAKLARKLAERMVTLGKAGGLAERRRAISVLRLEKFVTKLFAEIAPQFKDRLGGYTRIIRLDRRMSDGAEMAILEWVGITPPDKKRKPPKGDTKAKAQ